MSETIDAKLGRRAVVIRFSFHFWFEMLRRGEYIRVVAGLPPDAEVVQLGKAPINWVTMHDRIEVVVRSVTYPWVSWAHELPVRDITFEALQPERAGAKTTPGLVEALASPISGEERDPNKPRDPFA